jgi:hypothetical protein
MGGTSANRLTSALDGDVLGAAGGVQETSLSDANLPSGAPASLSTNAVMDNTGSESVVTGAASTGSGTPVTIVQPTIILNKIIKLT